MASRIAAAIVVLGFGAAALAQTLSEVLAKANEKIAQAQLAAKHDPSPGNLRRVAALRAEGAYEIGKQRCQDLPATERDGCIANARERYQRAQAEIEQQYPVAGEPAGAAAGSGAAR